MAEQNYKDFFDEAMKQIRDEYRAAGNENEFLLNFNLSYIEDTISEITVSVSSKFMWDRMVLKGYIEKIQSKINELTGQKINLSPIFNSKPVEVIENPTKIKNPPKLKNSDSKMKNSSMTNSNFSESEDYSLIPKAPIQPQLIPHPQLIEDYTFENFVPGDNSDYAYKACLAAAENPGSKNYNPILLYGPSGVGKTHLMVSIGNYIYAHNPNKKICYTTTESFMNDFTAALRQKTTDKFIKKYRSFDVFLLDDIQFLEGKEKLTDEVFFTFEAIYKRKGQIVFTSDRSLKFIKGIEERIGSRFKYGPNIDLKAPSYETRLAIIDKKLEVQGKSIPQDVKEFIAKNFQSNVRELEGALSRMIGYAELMHKELTLEIAKEQLNDSINPTGNGIVSVEMIQKAVSELYNVSIDDLKSSSRKKTVAIPRHVAIYLCRELTEYSLDEIGEEFGGRDHSTVISSINKIEDRLKTGDLAISDIIKALTKQISNGK